MELLVALFVVLVLRNLLAGTGGNTTNSPTQQLIPPGSNASDYGPVDTLTDAWARFEGFYQQGSVAQRYNNPDNVKGDYPGVIGKTASGIDIFDDVGDGWDAGRTWVQQQEQEHPDWSFSQLFAKVLGSLDGTPVNNDQGNSDNEANFVASYLGVPADYPVADYTGDS